MRSSVPPSSLSPRSPSAAVPPTYRQLHASAPPRRPLRAVVAAYACLGVAACAADPGTGGGGAAGGEITIQFKGPTEKALLTGTITVEGTVQTTGPVQDVEVVVTAKTTELARVKGKAFSAAWDTTAKDAKGAPLFKDGNQCVTVAATAKSGESASATRCVTLDNTGPQLTLTTPLADSVHIGKVAVAGTVSDKNLVIAEVYISGDKVVAWCDKALPATDPASCQACKKTYAACLSGPGSFAFTIDRSDKPSAKLVVQVRAADAVGSQASLDVPVQVLAPPRFETFRNYPVAECGQVLAIRSGDVDGDGIVDAMVAGQTGVCLVRGAAKPGSDPPVAAGGFGVGEKLVEGLSPLLERVDLDGDKVLDFVAIVQTSGGFEVAAILSRKGGAKVVQRAKLGGTPKALAVGDLNNDGTADVVVGGVEDKAAIEIVPVLPGAVCPGVGALATRTCKDAQDLAKLGDGVVFGGKKALQITGNVATLALDDFVNEGDSATWADIAVGRSDKALVTVCRNNAGTFEDCVDSYSTDYVADLADTKALLATDWDLDGTPDLILGSQSKGVLRWLRGLGNGQFQHKAGEYRQFLTKFDSLALHPIGPGGETYVAVLSGGREVIGVPVDPADHRHMEVCLRAFVIGGTVVDIAPADVDGDGKLDMVALDTSPWGLSVSLGHGDGTFRASAVHKVCGWPSDSFTLTNLKVGRFLFEDLTTDGKPDLLLAAVPGRARTKQCPPSAGSNVPRPLPAYHVALYVNLGTKLDSFSRSGEFSPYFAAKENQAGFTEDPMEAGCGGSVPAISGLKAGEFGGGGGRDFAMSLDVEYFHGNVPDAIAGDDVNKPNTLCTVRDFYEISNHFGPEKKEGEDASPNSICKNFNAKDKDMKTPLRGYSQGSPWNRTSLLLFLTSINVAEPLGIGLEHSPTKPAVFAPFYSQAGGKRPIDVVVGRFDEDGFDDVATVMDESGAQTDPLYLGPRVRLFRGGGNGKVRAQLVTNLQTAQAQKIAQDFNIDTNQVDFLPAVTDEIDTFKRIDPNTGLVAADIPVTYRIVGSKPLAALGGNFCQSSLTSVFALGANGNLTVVRSMGAMKTSRVGPQSLADQASVFSLGQLTVGDGCTDYLYASSKLFGFVAGTSAGWQANAPFAQSTEDLAVVAIGNADINQDKIADLLVVDSKRAAVVFFLGDGAGGFVRHQVPIDLSPGDGRMVQGDLDGDGCVDLAVQGELGVTVIKNLGCQAP